MIMNHPIIPIPVKPWTLNGIPDHLIVSHYENNYGNAVRSLNAIRDRLEEIDLAGVPGHEIRALKQEELLATGSVFLHELYFASLGLGSSGFSGDGKIPAYISSALEQHFGGVAPHFGAVPAQRGDWRGIELSQIGIVSADDGNVFSHNQVCRTYRPERSGQRIEACGVNRCWPVTTTKQRGSFAKRRLVRQQAVANETRIHLNSE